MLLLQQKINVLYISIYAFFVIIAVPVKSEEKLITEYEIKEILEIKIM